MDSFLLAFHCAKRVGRPNVNFSLDDLTPEWTVYSIRHSRNQWLKIIHCLIATSGVLSAILSSTALTKQSFGPVVCIMGRSNSRCFGCDKVMIFQLPHTSPKSLSERRAPILGRKKESLTTPASNQISGDIIS